MRRRLCRAACCLLLAAACLPGCGIGLIYTNITTPLDTNFDGTPIHFDASDSDAKRIDVDFVTIEWGSAGLVDAARRRGLDLIYYADLRTLQVLGIWTQRFAIVYGTRVEPGEVLGSEGGAGLRAPGRTELTCLPRR